MERGKGNTKHRSKARRTKQNRVQLFIVSEKKRERKDKASAKGIRMCVWAGEVKGELNRNAERGNEAGRETGTRALKLRFSS